MNSLAKKLQISWLDPLLFDVNTYIIESSLKGGVRKRCTAPQPEAFKTNICFDTTEEMSYNYHYATGRVN